MENKKNTFLGLRKSPRVTKLDFRNGKISKYTGKGRPREEFDYAEGQGLHEGVRGRERRGRKCQHLFMERREVRDKLIARFIDEVNTKLREYE